MTHVSWNFLEMWITSWRNFSSASRLVFTLRCLWWSNIG